VRRITGGVLRELGHTVKLIAPQHVKPYISATRTTGGMPRNMRSE